MFEDDGDREYVVVRNTEEQYSIWPVRQALPPGWQRAGRTGPKADCLSEIAELWTDLRPRSARAAQERR
ncbi:MbtH family protein [Catenuloplanes indicus]|uniref:MbtH protein n=1 Tax=Catenuloplanes indicus TaxID=137267 RepID=A0AAE3W7X7_9ACTN|nr:MbtH family NRPS accessory protein [Catenuloplanes indicus]MDQ0371184.1 MbtH protein [Catenuloplanes indicus]